jgi:nitroreductase
MDAIEALRSRRSVRKYSDRSVPDDLINKIADCGRLAATGLNEQPWEFIVIRDQAMRDNLKEICDYGKFINKAPVCIVVFCRDCKYYLEDGSAATQNILVAATALGLGSCWVAGDKKPYAERIRNLLGVPGGHKLISLVSIGYSTAASARIKKRSLDEVMHKEKF